MEKRRTEYTHEEKINQVSQWQMSGKGKSIYCKEVGIPYTTFRHWLDKYHGNQGQLPSQKPKQSQPSFLSIQLQEPIHNQELGKPVMELIFNNGARLNFYQAVSVDYIQQLLDHAKH